MAPTPPNPESRTETAQEFNGASTVLAAVLEDKTLTVASTVVFDTAVDDPVRYPSEVASFPFQIGVPPPLPPPLMP